MLVNLFALSICQIYHITSHHGTRWWTKSAKRSYGIRIGDATGGDWRLSSGERETLLETVASVWECRTNCSPPAPFATLLLYLRLCQKKETLLIRVLGCRRRRLESFDSVSVFQSSPSSRHLRCHSVYVALVVVAAVGVVVAVCCRCCWYLLKCNCKL